MRLNLTASLAAIVLAGAMPAAAQDVYAPYEPNPAPPVAAAYDYGDTDFVFELGIGVAAQPDYLGSDNYMASIYGFGSVEYLNIPGLGAFGGRDGRGFSIGPSFNYVGERDSNDLAGIDGVDATYELGLRAGYEWDNAEVYGALRYGLGGAEGLTGDIGANLIARPTDRLRLKAGPVATFADADYNDAYFSVSPREFVNSGGRFAAYDAGGGFNSVGIHGEARYEIFTDYFVNLDASWNRLVGDAGDSPIVKVAGDDDQYYIGLGVSKRFSLDLF
ncbi:MipA/OmpV family protein [Fulvimarina endophytica]|uniref:MipA/OmpV family protein n=2 Tax=Fulvimarina endophytica TaxID=2293836 RepID=A0A371X1Q7_9HYPH|nr:MipA/OmpV family protein [Fulvimarina endophytica]